MNLRDRAWRRKVARVVKLLDERIETGPRNDALYEVVALRERLAGACGAEEGWTSTPELRRRAESDFALALSTLGLEEPPLSTPAGDPATDVLSRGFDRFQRAAPLRGDRS